MKNKKIINLMMTSGLLLSSVLATTTQATTVFAETNQEQVESNEITAINVSIKSNLELSYGFDSDYYLSALNNNFRFTDPKWKRNIFRKA